MFSKPKPNGRRGFTLIELLVVISIIGLLSSVVLASLNSARAKARDAVRKSDLKQIRIALELYYNEYGGYPSSAWPNEDYRIFQSLALETKMTIFLTRFPTDPLTTTGCYDEQYLYISDVYKDGSGNNAKATKYSIYTSLENQSTNNLSTLSNHDNYLRGDPPYSAEAWGCDANRKVNFKLTGGGGIN